MNVGHTVEYFTKAMQKKKQQNCVRVRGFVTGINENIGSTHTGLELDKEKQLCALIFIKNKNKTKNILAIDSCCNETNYGEEVCACV